MSAHDHAEIVPGCFRCEIGADETNPAFDYPRPLTPLDDLAGMVWKPDPVRALASLTDTLTTEET